MSHGCESLGLSELSASKIVLPLELPCKVFTIVMTICDAILSHAGDLNEIITLGEVKSDNSYLGEKRKDSWL